MLASIILILIVLAALSGGLIALFAGRRLYAIWLGFATYFFISRVLDLALFRTSENVRNLGGLVLAVLVVAGFGVVLFTFVGVHWLVRAVRLESLHGF